MSAAQLIKPQLRFFEKDGFEFDKINFDSQLQSFKFENEREELTNYIVAEAYEKPPEELLCQQLKPVLPSITEKNFPSKCPKYESQSLL